MKAIEVQELHYADAPADVLWERRDLVLVAAGSGPCLRELYYRARKQGRLSQLVICQMTGEDYVMGTAEEKIVRSIRQAAGIAGSRVVVLYLNCMDILTRLDFDYIEKILTEETGVQVRCFFRGPLAKMDIQHYLPVKQFMQQLPDAEGTVTGRLFQLPPLMTDIAGVLDCLPQKSELNVLAAPSGCRACLRDGDLLSAAQEQYYLDSTDQDFVFGLEGACLKQCRQQLALKRYRGINVLSTAVASFIGFDGDWVAKEMETEGIKGRYFAMDGFGDAVYGASCAQRLLVQQEAVGFGKDVAKEVLLLGYTPLLCGDREQYKECFECIRQLGYEPRLLNEPLVGRPALSWCVSTAGLAAGQLLLEQYGVPLLVSCPVGSHALKMWRKNVQELCQAQATEQRQLCIHNYTLKETDTRRILLVGDPVQTMGVAHALWHAGFQHLQLAVISHNAASRRLYRQAPGADKWLIIVDSLTALQDLWEDADIVFADLQLAELLLEAGATSKTVIPLPWGVISGQQACYSGSGVLGQEIALHLQSLIK